MDVYNLNNSALAEKYAYNHHWPSDRYMSLHINRLNHNIAPEAKYISGQKGDSAMILAAISMVSALELEKHGWNLHV